MKRTIDRIIDGLLVLLILAMTAVIAVSVFMRYVLNNPQSWTDEVARIMIAWISFLGAYMALREGRHIGFDLVAKKMPGWLRTVNDLVGRLFVLVFLAVMIWQGVNFSRAFFLTPMEYTQIPLGLVAYSAVAVSGVLMFVQTAIGLVETLRARTAGRAEGSPT